MARLVFSYPSATIFFHLALLGFPLIVVALFASLRPRRAVIWCCLIAALFLPEGGYGFRGLPDYSKYSALSVVLLASIIFDGGKPLRVRPRWIDIPIFVWCAGRVATSLSNDLGVYDGLSSMLNWITLFGLPYWLGRVYFADAAGLRELTRGIVWGGILYIPLCLFEIRFSPQLHATVYGFMTVPFMMVTRYGGYRPIVFMDSSLQVAMWMSATTVITWWLAYSGALKRVAGVPATWIAWGLLAITLLCKARGALLLSLIGIVLFIGLKAWKHALPFALLLALVSSYPALRGTGLLDAERILSAADLVFGEERLASLGTRLRSEDLYIGHVAERPILGWGGYGRGEVFVDGVRTIPDGLWVIALSQAGWLAVTALLALYLIPPFLLVRRYPASLWTRPEFAPIAALMLLLMLYWVDCLSNAMVTPVLVVAIGAANGWFAEKRSFALEEPLAIPPTKAGGTAPTKVSLARGLTAKRRARGSRPSAP